MSNLSTLIAVRDQRMAEQNEARERLEAAEHALLVERFKDYPQYREGDIVLVPRKLFGEVKLWPARIADVHLGYNSGIDAHGAEWESLSVSYTVFMRRAGGTFDGVSEGYSHDEVVAAVLAQDSSSSVSPEQPAAQKTGDSHD